MRDEIDNKFETILKEIKNNTSVSTATNPRSETNETQDTQQSGSKINKTPAEERDIFRPELFYNYINLRLKNN